MLENGESGVNGADHASQASGSVGLCQTFFSG
jgi:hypothetical protein